jgi:hypothetical protein
VVVVLLLLLLGAVQRSRWSWAHWMTSGLQGKEVRPGSHQPLCAPFCL